MHMPSKLQRELSALKTAQDEQRKSTSRTQAGASTRWYEAGIPPVRHGLVGLCEDTGGGQGKILPNWVKLPGLCKGNERKMRPVYQMFIPFHYSRMLRSPSSHRPR